MIRLAIALLVLGAIIAWNTGPLLLKSYRAQSWPVAEGKVTWSQVTLHKRGKGGILYTPLVRYRYEADGKERRAEGLGIGNRSYRKLDDAEAVVRRYLVGQEVTAHYNPAQPKEAYLNIDFPWRVCWGFIVSVLMLGGGVYAALRGWRGLQTGPYHQGWGL